MYGHLLKSLKTLKKTGVSLRLELGEIRDGTKKSN